MTRVAHIQHIATVGRPPETGYIHHSILLLKSLIDVPCSVFNRPYLVFNETGYSKHYYAGAERVSSRIGGGMQDGLVDPLNYTVAILSGQDYTAMAGDLQDMLSRNIECTDMPMQYVSMEQQLASIQDSRNHNNFEDNRYIYHSYHLGSSAFLTDANGIPTQHLQYLPFGEPFIEQRSATEYYTPYTFSAKERDMETGYSYFGARYYNSQISVWLSVDPLSDKYPSMSPFMYCAGNPVMLVDKIGLEPEDNENGGIKKFFRSFLNFLTDGKWQDPRDEDPFPRQILRAHVVKDTEYANDQNNTLSHLRSPLEDAPKQDFSGFWGKLRYFMYGGYVDGYSYDKEGNPIGLAPTTGSPPMVGRTRLLRLPKVGGASKAGSQGGKTLQSTGHTLNKSTLKALNISKEQGKFAIESLKKEAGLPPNFHGKILSNGDYIHPKTNQVLGNLFEFIR